MSTSTSGHHEHWEVRITPDEQDSWPATAPYRGSTTTFAPDEITFKVVRGFGTIGEIRVAGQRLKKDGTLAQNRSSARFYWPEGVPDWVREEINAARARHNLTDEALER